jgi:hypothetical protein
MGNGNIFADFNKRNIKRITAAYTATVDINTIYAGGSSAYAITLYDIITTLRGTTGGAIYVENNGTAVVTLTAATDDTINGRTTYALQPGQRVIIGADKRRQRWVVSIPDFMPLDVATQERSITVTTTGTTAVNVFGASGAPRDLEIIDWDVTSLDTTAGNITLTTAGGAVEVIAKGTAEFVKLGGIALANTSVEQGGLCTIVSSSAGNVRSTITYIIAAAQEDA